MSTRTRLSANEGGGHNGCVARILKYTQRIARRGKKFGHWRLLGPRKARCVGGLPLKGRSRVSMTDFDEGHKVRVVAIIVLHQNSIVMQADNCDPVAEILGERCDPETERGAWA